MAVNYTDPNYRDIGGTGAGYPTPMQDSGDWFSQNAPPAQGGGFQYPDAGTPGNYYDKQPGYVGPSPYDGDAATFGPTTGIPAGSWGGQYPHAFDPATGQPTATNQNPASGTTPTTALAGWDQTKWSDPNKSDPKYDVGRILAKFPPTTAGLQQAWPEIQKLYPGATFDGKDSISGIPGTMGAVDVLAGASQGGTSWWWGDQGAMGQQGGAQGGQAGAGGAAGGSPYGSFQNAPSWQGGDYQMPNATDFRNSPGYQAGMDAQQQAIQRSAAAKGTVLNGGTMKALSRYAADYADQGYQQYDQNAFRNYQSRYGQFRDQVGDTRNNNTDLWGRLNDLYSTGAQAAAGSYKPGVTT